MTHLRHSFLQFVGDFATTHPRAWLYSFMLLGMATAIVIYGGIGYWLGGFVGHATTGMYLGLGWYGCWFATNVETLSAAVDHWVHALEKLKRELA